MEPCKSQNVSGTNSIINMLTPYRPRLLRSRHLLVLMLESKIPSTNKDKVFILYLSTPLWFELFCTEGPANVTCAPSAAYEATVSFASATPVWPMMNYR
jgi:hypothetical protein